MAVIITDIALDPYFMVCEKGSIDVYKRAKRKKKDGNEEDIKKLIKNCSTMMDAIKTVTQDTVSSRSNKVVTVGKYVVEYKKRVNELKSFLKLQDNDYI